jgi:lysozyme
MGMSYSKTGLALTESFEGCKLTAYQDVRGIWTIGFGHTGTAVHPSLTWTQAQADAQLSADIAWASNVVNALVTISITQGEHDGLTDLVFNIGAHAFATSTLLKKLNSGNIQGAIDEFDKWDHASGKVVAGLLRRRQAETALFESKL